MVIYEVGADLNGKTLKQVTLYGKGIASSANLKSDGVSFNYPNTGFNVICTDVLGSITVNTEGKLSKNILMAVPAGAQIDSVFIRMTDNQVYSLGSTNKDAMAASSYRYIKGASFKRDEAKDDMLLTGVFSVADDKQVFFSKGNLRYTVGQSKWNFFDNQYDCGPDTYEGGHDNEISLFTWGYDAVNSIVPDGSSHIETVSMDMESLNKSEDWGFVFGGNDSVWRTLSAQEFYYLFAWNVDLNYGDGGFDSNLPRCDFFKYGVSVSGKKNCAVLVPDGWDLESNPLQAEYSSISSPMTWTQAEAAGLVCLPAAGYREANSITPGLGTYCTSTICYPNYVQTIFSFNEEDLFFAEFTREYGCSVRLISDCK